MDKKFFMELLCELQQKDSDDKLYGDEYRIMRLIEDMSLYTEEAYEYLVLYQCILKMEVEEFVETCRHLGIDKVLYVNEDSKAMRRLEAFQLEGATFGKVVKLKYRDTNHRAMVGLEIIL